jgi:carbamoyl-phosphate synthase large subunit
VCVDADWDVIGRFWGDKFHQVPMGTDPNYIEAMEEVIAKEKPDVFFPVSSMEVLPVSKNKARFERHGCKVLVSDPEPLETATNKYNIYKTLQDNGIPTPEFYWPKNLDEFIDIAKDMGYPKRKICFKPFVSKGSRGFRILDDTISRRDLLLNHKPNSLYMSLDEFIEIFKDEEEFPDFMIMEFMEGMEYDVMDLCYEGDSLLITPKSREVVRWGVVTFGQFVDRPDIIDMCRQVIKAIPLSYTVGLQLIETKLVEINPRTSAYIFQEDLIMAYLSIKLALGEITRDEIREYQIRVGYGRKFIRYMDQIFWDKRQDPDFDV